MNDRYIADHDDTGVVRLLIRVEGAGGLSRYAGAGTWVPDGHLAGYLGMGGSSDGTDVDPADVPAVMAALDARFAAIPRRSAGDPDGLAPD